MIKSSSLDCMVLYVFWPLHTWFTIDQIFMDINVLFSSSETVPCMCANMHPKLVVLVFYCSIYTCQIWNHFCCHCTCCLGECSSVKAHYSHTIAELRLVYTYFKRNVTSQPWLCWKRALKFRLKGSKPKSTRKSRLWFWLFGNVLASSILYLFFIIWKTCNVYIQFEKKKWHSDNWECQYYVEANRECEFCIMSIHSPLM